MDDQTTVADPPQISEEDTLLAAAMAHDNSGASLSDKPIVNLESPVITKPADATPKDQHVETKPAEDKQTIVDPPVADTTPLDKEAIRKERTWENLNTRKTTLADQESRFNQERQKFEQDKANHLRQVTSDTESQTALPEDWAELAKKYEEEGDTEKAKLAMERAHSAQDLIARAKQQKEVDTRTNQWNANYQEEVRTHPELSDPASETYKTLLAVLREYPDLTQNPNGIKYAMQHVDALGAGANADALRVENEKLRAQVEVLEGKTQIDGGPAIPGAPAGGGDFESLSLDDQEKALERTAAASSQTF